MVIAAGYGQENERESRPFRLGMAVVVSPNYYTQLGFTIEPTYSFIENKLTVGIRYMGLWAVSNITSNQSLSMVSDMYFIHKQFNFFFRSVGIGIGLFNDRDSTKKNGMYVSTVTANHIGFMIRAGGVNKINHTRLTLEYDYVSKTQSLNVSNSIFGIVWGFYIWGGYYDKYSARYDYRFRY
jgi:hypothetical protein